MKKILFVVFPLLLIFGCEIFERKPSLSDEEKSFRYFHRSIGFHSEESQKNPPVEVIKDGYKMIKLIYDSNTPEKIDVEYGWMYEVKNLSSKRKNVTVTYKLVDKDDFTITTDEESIWLEIGETDIIRSTSTFDYSDLERVYSSSWSILLNFLHPFLDLDRNRR